MTPLLARAAAGHVRAIPPTWFDAARVVPGGHRRLVDAVAYRLTDHDGTVREIVLIQRDHTALRAAEQLAGAQTAALTASLAMLATEPDLGRFLGHVLGSMAA